MNQKKSMRVRLGPVGHAVLMTIAAAGVLTVAVCAPNALQILKPFLKKKKYSGKQAVQRNIQSLMRTGLVRMCVDEHGNPALELTRKGKWEMVIRRSAVMPEKKKEKWDGYWRVVVFDVPNTKEKLRNELRDGMHMYGFHLLQKSVWVYPYACDEFVRILREHLEIQEDVLYMTVLHIENEKELRKSFRV
jgi:phenylacetic acid degradation operon negative regulatory protein